MAIRMKFSDTDRITIDGVNYRTVSHTDTGVVLDQIAQPGMANSYSFDDLLRMLGSQTMRVERGYFDRTNREQALRHDDLLCQLPRTLVGRLLWQQACCNAFLEMATQGAVCRTSKSIQSAMTILREKVRTLDEASQLVGRVRRAGAELSTRQFPSPKTLLNWVRKYEAGGHSPLALIPGTFRSGNSEARFDIATEALLAKCIDDYADYQRPSKNTIVDATLRVFRQENREHQKSGKSLLHIPSQRTILRRIARLDPYYLHSKRFGIAAANRKFNIFELGLKSMRPMERVEMDEWQIDLINLLAPTGLLEHVDPKRLAEIQRGRRWLYVAIDHATRCILSMRLAETPSGFEAVRTLEDITRDKTRLARAMDCESPWGFHGGIASIVTDQGSAFVSEVFREAVASLGGTIEFPPAGVPTLRSTIERCFGSFGTKLMPLLAGRTFSNVSERGDYNSDYWASLSDDELIQVLVMFVVDIYHNEPHSGLGGETPANCWKRLSHEFGVTPPPDAHVRRAVFGSRHSRRLSGRGVRVFGIDYACDALRQLFIHSEKQIIDIRVDEQDLGWIAVRVENTWHAAPALQSCFDGVSYSEWREAARYLRVKYRKQAEFSQSTVSRAIERISDANRKAMQRLSLTPHRLTDAQLERSELELYLGLSIALPRNAEMNPPPEADLFDGAIEISRQVPATQKEKGAISPRLTGGENPQSSNKEIPPSKWEMEDE